MLFLKTASVLFLEPGSLQCIFCAWRTGLTLWMPYPPLRYCFTQLGELAFAASWMPICTDDFVNCLFICDQLATLVSACGTSLIIAISDWLVVNMKLRYMLKQVFAIVTFFCHCLTLLSELTMVLNLHMFCQPSSPCNFLSIQLLSQCCMLTREESGK